MTSRCALIQLLLSGDVVNLRTCYRDVGYSNVSREIIRMVEKPFGVEVSRTPMNGKTRYGTHCSWYNYRLNHTKQNAEGIAKMAMYVAENGGLKRSGKITKTKE